VATNLILRVRDELQCSSSALWNNLRQLKRIGIVDFGDIESKGKKVVLTHFGKLLCDGVQIKYLGGKYEIR
jgi:hypothetical protein